MATIIAVSGNPADVQSAMLTALDGDTVRIPAGTWTWTSGITMTLNKSLTLQGVGAISATTNGASTVGSDVTIILDHHPTVGHSLLNLSVVAGKLLRITAIAFKQDGSSTTTQNGVLKVAGSTNGIRIDHCHFVSNPDSTMSIQVNSNSTNALTGVIDHNYFDSAVGNGPFGVYLQHGVGNGDAAWAAPDDWGTANFLYIEDNRWRNGYFGDANTGGQRFVFRYNTMDAQVNDSVPTVGYCANHGLTSGRGRSTRAVEYYGNVCTALAPGLNKSPFPFNGGTGLVWGNTISQYRYCTALDYTRKNNNTYPYGTPPTGWGNCNGTTGTVWDGAGGTIGLDQPGRGRGQLLSGSTIATTVNTSTGTQAWPNQALSPFYVWGNTFNPAGFSPTPVVANAASPMITQNREYYSSEGAVAGVTGVVSGLFSARPVTCTTGTGYFATDQQKLYVASATNVWSLYYTPYVYPHPLASGTVTPPALLTADRIIYNSRFALGTIPFPSGGDLNNGSGMAARRVNGQLRIYLASFNPAAILEFSVPDSLSGTATYIRNIGQLPADPGAIIGGLLWDGSYLYQASHGIYDGEPAIGRTISRGTLNESTGLLEVATDANGVREFYTLSPTPDKWTQGGLTKIPAWFTSQSLPAGYTLGAGFGGYRSVVTTGPASMGPAFTAFAPPLPGAQAPPVPNRVLQAYPFGTSVTGTPRQQRPTNYVNEFQDGFPTNPTTTGYWTWCDQIFGGGAWIDTGVYSGLVTLAYEGVNCCFYGHNDGSLSPCANTPGTPASINSSSGQHVWNITNPTDLAAVAAGANPSSIQSAFTQVQFPGITYPLVGAQGLFTACTGMAWLPEENLLLCLMRFPNQGAGRPIVLTFRIQGGVIPPTPPALSITTSSLPNGVLGAQYAGIGLQATGGVPPYTWSATGVPAGMTLSTAGLLTGTPTVPGTFTVAATVTDTQPVMATRNLSLLISQPTIPDLVLDTTTFGTTEEDRPFTATAQAHGGVPPYTWAFTSVPAGLSGNASTGVLSGTPTTPGAYTVNVSVTDARPVTVGPTGIPLTVTAAPVVPTLTLDTTDFGSTEEDKPFSVTAHASGGVVPYVWTFTSLPTGLTGNTTTGVISGTPTTPGNYTVQVTVTDARPVAVGPTGVPLEVTATPPPPIPAPPVITTTTLPDGVVGALYNQTLAATGLGVPLRWACSNLPGGLALSTTGVLSGIPTTAATTNLAVTVTDAFDQSDPATIPLTIAAAPIPAPVITTTSLPDATVGTPYQATLTATGGVAPLRWSSSNLPAGLSLSTAGEITGLATTPDEITLLVTVTDAQPLSTPGSIPFTVLRADPPVVSDLVITTASLPEAQVGAGYLVQLTATGGQAPFTWVCSNLPAGLSMTTSGVLSGTPMAADTIDLTIGISDSQTPPDQAGAVLTLVITGPNPNPEPNPPNTPTAYSPKNRQSKVTDATTNGPFVRWWRSDRAESYQVYHGTIPNPPFVGSVDADDPTYLAEYPGGSYQWPVTRVAKTTYYWRIVAVNGAGVTSSPVWRYRTK